MEFFETSIFTRDVGGLLSSEEQRALQNLLLERPQAGPLIPKGGGVRKLRFAQGNHGKRGGVRIIYYYHSGLEVIFLLLVYPKGRQDSLSDSELAELRKLVKGEFR